MDALVACAAWCFSWARGRFPWLMLGSFRAMISTAYFPPRLAGTGLAGKRKAVAEECGEEAMWFAQLTNRNSRSKVDKIFLIFRFFSQVWVERLRKLYCKSVQKKQGLKRTGSLLLLLSGLTLARRRCYKSPHGSLPGWRSGLLT